MERAIEVMHRSINEPRENGEVSPKVGAVLWKADGTIESAFRGELRQGDHAEYTLLERKNGNNCLDDAILFATLEPCGPDSRKPPKLGCAKRIVNARIKEVWVGVEDPHPRVAGKGFEYLRRHGVKVHPFDRDLQDVIKKENAVFFTQALERAEKEKFREVIVLSEYEKVSPKIALDDLSKEALERYRSFLGMQESAHSREFYQRLELQGLVEVIKGKTRPTGFGALLFGKHPRDTMEQAGVLGTIHYEGGKEELRDFDGPAVLVPEQVISWLKEKLPNPIDRSGAQRVDTNANFYELVREGLANAIVHRDYAIKGAKCQLVVTPETIVIKSPGSPIDPITVEQLQSFNAPMLSRNPRLHSVFSKMELAEERGLGLKSMKSRATEIGLPLPKYSWENPYLVLTLYRSKKAAEQALVPVILASLSSAERAGWQWLATKEMITSDEYAEGLGVPNRTALHHLKRLTDLGLLQKTGSGRATRYRIIRG